MTDPAGSNPGGIPVKREAEMKNAKRLVYYVAVYPDEKGCYMVTFPDFPEMAPDFGKNFDDCILSASRFLDEVISDMVEHGRALPVPTPLEVVRTKLTPQDRELLCMVPVTVYPPARTERINITGKGDVFARINDYARRHHLTRSELMLRATLDCIRANS